ncbi:MAG: hypothetical protein L3K26_10915 [Candidatus Hydrogenedentes bacterium]|nr:hypothetical protein [Candidatus Hydrogenedentota bacterium]
MRTIYAITMWSGGQAAKKWQTCEKPELLTHGTGIRFVCRDTKLAVELIGPVSIEEYESGKEDIEEIRDIHDLDMAEIPVRSQPEDNGNDQLH